VFEPCIFKEEVEGFGDGGGCGENQRNMVGGRAEVGVEVGVGEELGEPFVDEQSVQERELNQDEAINHRVELGCQPLIEVGVILVCRGTGEIEVPNDKSVRVTWG
jgi:hypothetical protein